MRAGLDQAGVSPENRQVIRVEPIIDWVAGDFKPTFQLLECVSALLLVIACATVANALLVRVTERHGELAIRVSLEQAADASANNWSWKADYYQSQKL